MGTSGGQIDHCPADACNRDWYRIVKIIQIRIEIERSRSLG